MSGRPWYKRYGAAFVHGSLGLTLEEKGAYSLCLDLIYDRGGPIPDDARWLAGVCGVSLRKWAALRASLISAGKIDAVDGHLTNRRAEREIESAAKTSRILSENGSKGGAKRAENASASNKTNEIDEAELKHRAQVQRLEVREEDTSSLRSDVGAAEPPATKAMKSGSKRRCQVDASGYQPEIAAALEIGLSQAEAEIEVPRFLDHHRAKGSLMLKWDAAWRGWCRNAVQWRRPAPPGQQRAPPPAKGTNAMLDSLAKFATRNDHDDRPPPDHIDLPAISRGH